MKSLELLKGKHIIVNTEVGVSVELEIKDVKQNIYSEDLEPSTRENDWWPASRSWETYTVYFTNGSKKTFDSLDEINIY